MRVEIPFPPSEVPRLAPRRPETNNGCSEESRKNRTIWFWISAFSLATLRLQLQQSIFPSAQSARLILLLYIQHIVPPQRSPAPSTHCPWHRSQVQTSPSRAFVYGEI